MISKRLFGLFQKGKRFTHNLSGNTIEAAPTDSEAIPRNMIKEIGSPLVINLIKNDVELLQYYENYLVAYNHALLYLAEQDYKHARIKADEALANLVNVEVITAALGKDFWKITELSNLIQESSPKNKC